MAGASDPIWCHPQPCRRPGSPSHRCIGVFDTDDAQSVGLHFRARRLPTSLADIEESRERRATRLQTARLSASRLYEPVLTQLGLEPGGIRCCASLPTMRRDREIEGLDGLVRRIIGQCVDRAVFYRGWRRLPAWCAASCPAGRLHIWPMRPLVGDSRVSPPKRRCSGHRHSGSTVGQAGRLVISQPYSGTQLPARNRRRFGPSPMRCGRSRSGRQISSPTRCVRLVLGPGLTCR